MPPRISCLPVVFLALACLTGCPPEMMNVRVRPGVEAKLTKKVTVHLVVSEVRPSTMVEMRRSEMVVEPGDWPAEFKLYGNADFDLQYQVAAFADLDRDGKVSPGDWSGTTFIGKLPQEWPFDVDVVLQNTPKNPR